MGDANQALNSQLMSEGAAAFDFAALSMMFPFHLVLGPDAKILSTGPSIALLEGLEGIVDKNVFEVFTFRALGPVSTIEGLKERAGGRFTLSLVSNPNHTLKGNVIPFDNYGTPLLLVGLSLGLEWLCCEEMEYLNRSHFSATDLSLDLRYISQMLSSMVEQTARVNRELSDALARLRHMKGGNQRLNQLMTFALTRAKFALTYRETADQEGGQVHRVGYDPGGKVSKFLRLQGETVNDLLAQIAREHPYDVKITALDNGHDTLRSYFLEIDMAEIWALREVVIDESSYALLWSDVTVQLAADKRVHQNQKMESLGVLTRGMAHDFNNILAIISTGLETIGLNTVPGRDDGTIEDLLKTTDRARKIVRQLLTFSGEKRQPSKQANLYRILETLRDILPDGLAPDCHLSCDADPDIWLACDAELLASVLVNLVTNAQEAKEVGLPCRIHISQARVGAKEAAALGLKPGHDFEKLIVSDNGRGIPEAILQRVCEPFFSTKQAQNRSGLGLSMAFGFAQEAGGLLQVSANHPRGTRVTLYLPQRSAVVEQTVPEEPSCEIAMRARRMILVVEDEDILRAMVRKFLIGQNHEVIDVGNCAEMVALLERMPDFRPDIVLSDFRLPDGDATDIFNMLGARVGGSQNFVMSGNMSEINIAALPPQTTLIEKPIRLFDLHERLMENAPRLGGAFS